MNRTEFETVNYQCPKLGGVAILTMEYLCHPTGKRVRSKFECDSERKCGIGKEGPHGTWTFDPSKCVCPFNKP
jgi:hypothetical protein